MFNLIKSYFKDESYYIIISNNYIHIKNYKSIESLSSKELIILIDKYKYIIDGINMIISKKINNEIQIKGNITNIIRYDNN